MATPWFVRPNTSHSGVRNGLTYATAWGGWSEVVWGAGGFTAGDTLFVCGRHSYSSSIVIGAHLGTANNRATITGDFALDPGSITFTSNLLFLENDRNGTNVVSLAVPSIFHQSSASFVTYQGLVLNVPGNRMGINISGSTGNNYTDIVIDGCTFTPSSVVTASAAIQWFASTADLTTMKRLTISNNKFVNFNGSRSIIHCRSQTDSDAATRMEDVLCFGNSYTNCTGTSMEFTTPGNPVAFGVSAGIKIQRNILNGVGESLTNPAVGGGIGVQGFTTSPTPGFGDNLIEQNRGLNIVGATGLVDVFYGTYIVQDNVGINISSTSIDGNGILFDFNCDRCIARRNLLINVTGKSGVTNSGVGVMILDNCTNIFVHGNIVDGARIGVFYGNSGTASSSRIEHNTFVNLTDEAVHTVSTASLINNQILQNNIFSGVGFTVRDLTAITWTGENYNYFYGFASGTFQHTLGANDVTGTLSQVNTTLGLYPSNYRLAPNSPGIGAASFLDYVTDFYGKPFRSPGSLGAIENTNLLPRARRV